MMLVPIWNSTTVSLPPSRAVELMFWTPWIERNEASIFCVIWFSISAGAAPGWLITTTTPGNSMSGSFCTFSCENATMPASISPMKMTIGTTGLRMHQAEMLLKFIAWILPGWSSRLGRDWLDRLTRLEESAGPQNHPFGA